MPTSNFFSEGGYYRNTIVREKTAAELLSALNDRMEVNIKKPGAVEFAADLRRGGGAVDACAASVQGDHDHAGADENQMRGKESKESGRTRFISSCPRQYPRRQLMPAKGKRWVNAIVQFAAAGAPPHHGARWRRLQGDAAIVASPWRGEGGASAV